MKVVFSADRQMLGALHVAMLAVLQHWSDGPADFLVLSENLTDFDLALLRETLDKAGKKYALRLAHLEDERVKMLRKASTNAAPYYRLFLPEIIEDGKFLYVDADTICRVDISVLGDFDLAGAAVGMCGEAPIDRCADTAVAELLGDRARGWYFNSGFMLCDCAAWRKQRITERCLEFVGKHGAEFWDQSALNYVLHGEIRELPLQFNRLANVRTNWPLLRPPQSCRGQQVHLVDYPKPWSVAGRWVHMFGPMWWGLYEQTAHARSGEDLRRRFIWSRHNLWKYKQAFKDRVLFALYCRGLMTPKGVAAGATGSRGASVVQ